MKLQRSNLMIAVSKADEKDTMIKEIINLINIDN